MKAKQGCLCNFKYPKAKSLNRSVKTTSQRQKVRSTTMVFTDIYIRNKTASKNGGNRRKQFPEPSWS